MKRMYEKPVLKGVRLISSRRVAAVCWGNHNDYGANNPYWYDHNGTEPGFYRFTMTGDQGSGCDINKIVVWYYASMADKNAGIYTPQGAGSDGYNLVYNHILDCCKNPNANENYQSSSSGRIEDGDPEDFS